MRCTLLLLFINVILVFPSHAQTCSCAGAPLLSSQSTGAGSAGNLLLGLTYEYHDISSIYNGTNELRDETLERSTQSVLLEVNYGLTDRLSLSGTFSFVNKERITGLQTTAGGTTVSTNGLGDGMLLLRYVVKKQSLWNRYHLTLGAGAKAPFGTTSLTNNGIALNADMQPGTGSWDGVLWGYGAVSLLPFSTGNVSLLTSYRQTGSNDRFAKNDSYRFGNEFISNLGFSNQLFGNVSYLISLRYRSSSSDRLNNTIQSNTGGKWISLIPTVNYAFSDLLSIALSGRIPVFRDLNGTQPTTTYAVSGSLFININGNKNNGFNYGTPQ